MRVSEVDRRNGSGCWESGVGVDETDANRTPEMRDNLIIHNN